VTLPRSPHDAVSDGSSADVDVLIGTNLDEMRLFSLMDSRLAEIDETILEHRAASVFGSSAAKAVEVYRRSRPDAPLGDVWTAVLTDQVFRIPAVRLAEAQSIHQPRTYEYLFTWATPILGGRLGSCHALEIPFVFDNLDKPGAGVFTGDGAGRSELAGRVSQAWLAFARHGAPDVRVAPVLAGVRGWTAVNHGPRHRVRPRARPAGEERMLWDGVL